MQALGLPPGAPLPYERLGELTLLEMAFKEAMRVNPPVPGIPRAAVRDFEFGGHRIPAGTRVAVNALFTHRMPDIWPELLKFDPLRFTDAAVRARHKYAWMPFGGAHNVPGPAFRLHAGEELLLSPADDDKSKPCPWLRTALADVADPEAARWAPDTHRGRAAMTARGVRLCGASRISATASACAMGRSTPTLLGCGFEMG
jgi:hypothetical protein